MRLRLLGMRKCSAVLSSALLGCRESLGDLMLRALRWIDGDVLLVSRSAAALNERTRHGSDDALLDHHPGLGGILEGLLGRPLWSDRESQRSLVLLSGLEGMREARCEVLDILDGIMSA